MPSNQPFIQKALAAIQNKDFEQLEFLRDEVRPEYVAELIKTWDKSMPWLIKDGYVALLMDQTGDTVRPLMEDALKSPTPETRAYALCSLKGDFGIFESLLSSGGVDAKKVDEAIGRLLG